MSLSAYAIVKRSTNQTIADDTLTAVSFDTEVVDVGGFWVVGSPTLFTIPANGVYLIQGAVAWGGASANVESSLFIDINGTHIAGQNFVSNIDWPMTVSAMAQLAATDVVTLVAYHNSTGTRALDAAFILPSFSIARLS